MNGPVLKARPRAGPCHPAATIRPLAVYVPPREQLVAGAQRHAGLSALFRAMPERKDAPEAFDKGLQEHSVGGIVQGVASVGDARVGRVEGVEDAAA